MIIKKVFSSLLTLALTASSFALLAAATAPYVDPEKVDFLAFFGLMYPFLLLLHVMLFVCYLLTNRNKKALLFLIPAIATIHVFFNTFGINYFKSNTKPQQQSLTFMTYNVHMFESANGFYEKIQAPMLQLIQNEQPDILCMQDFRSTQTNGLNTIDSIKTVLDATDYYDGPKDPKLFPTQSIATFSKFPIVNSGYIVLSDLGGGNQAVFTDINKAGKIIRVYNVHFQSLGFQPYEYEEWKNADVIGKVEFLFKVKDKFSVAFARRSEQVKMVKKHAESCPYPYIIAGDFNDTPPSFAVNYTMSGMKNAFREKGSGYIVTFNGGLPDFQIDYILVKSFFKVLDYKVIRKKLSDHYPVIAVLSY